jgi:hypothetical protein
VVKDIDRIHQRRFLNFIKKISTTSYDDPNRSVIVKESLQERKQPYKKDSTLDLLILEYPLVEN